MTQRIKGLASVHEQDYLAAEEPLEIRIEGHSMAVVMRTPGDDVELTAGFLVTEGLVQDAPDIVDIMHEPHCSFFKQSRSERRASLGKTAGNQEVTSATRRPQNSAKLQKQRSDWNRTFLTDLGKNAWYGNLLNVRLRRPESLDLKRLTRHVFSSSSCGICSKASIDAVRQQFPPINDEFQVNPAVLLGMPAALASAQETFKRTGGLHACALFDLAGRLLVVREDVGRHNALDKIVGWALLRGCLPLHQHILLLSGRISFEMMQKALAAGIPMVAAISAPSSLAVEFARESGQTLVGFLREERMNVYAGADRLSELEPNHAPGTAQVQSIKRATHLTAIRGTSGNS